MYHISYISRFSAPPWSRRFIQRAGAQRCLFALWRGAATSARFVLPGLPSLGRLDDDRPPSGCCCVRGVFSKPACRVALQSQVIPFGALARCPGDRQLLKALEASVADRSANSQHCHSSVLVDGDEGSSRRQAPLQMSCSGRRLSTRDPSFLRTLQRLVTCVATAHYDGDIIKTIAQVGDGSSTCSLCTHPLSGSTRALPCCGAVASPHGPCVPGCPPCERGVWTSPQNLLHSGILCVQYPRQFCANLWALAVGGMWCSAPPTTASPLAASFKRSAHHDGPRCLACGDGQMAHPSTCGDAAVISGSLTAHAYGAPGVLRLSLRPRLSCQAPGPRPSFMCCCHWSQLQGQSLLHIVRTSVCRNLAALLLSRAGRQFTVSHSSPFCSTPERPLQFGRVLAEDRVGGHIRRCGHGDCLPQRRDFTPQPRTRRR